MKKRPHIVALAAADATSYAVVQVGALPVIFIPQFPLATPRIMSAAVVVVADL